MESAMTVRKSSAATPAGLAAAAGGSPSHIVISKLSKRFGDATLYDSFDLEVDRGRLVSIFGPNGCGKSTLINMISGIMPMDSGTVFFDGKPIRDTRIGYVFQNYREAVFPWLRAIDNIRYPLQFLPLNKQERTARVEELLASFDVKLDLNRYPYEMSGGQQQLVSIMRALVIEPEVLFLDEPFSALDYEMTMFLREKLQRALFVRNVTTLLVSHDLDEAVQMADEILLLTKKPTTVASRIKFNAARPRGEDVSLSPEFIETKAECLGIFQREARR